MRHMQCCRCDGFLVYGEELHCIKVNSKPTLWCSDCTEEFSWATWPDDHGPYPNAARWFPPHRRSVQ